MPQLVGVLAGRESRIEALTVCDASLGHIRIIILNRNGSSILTLTKSSGQTRCIRKYKYCKGLDEIGSELSDCFKDLTF